MHFIASKTYLEIKSNFKISLSDVGAETLSDQLVSGRMFTSKSRFLSF